MQPIPTKRVFPDHLVRDSDGKIAVDLAADYGYPSDDWQQTLISEILSTGEDGRFVCQSFGFSAPRRSGKSHAIIILALYTLLVREATVVYTSHRSDSSAEIWARVVELFEDTELSEYVAVNGISRRPGHETITLTSGAKFRIFSRSTGKGSGRGTDADLLILDEAMDLPQASLGDLQPILSVSENPQTIYLGTPSLESMADGIAFRTFRENVLNGTNPQSGWWEFSVPAGTDPYDRDAWRQANPALITGRITEAYIAGEVYSGMTEKQILVERLGSWETLSRPTVVDIQQFNQLGAEHHVIGEDSPMVIALDSDPDEKITTVVAAGNGDDGVPVVEVIERGPGSTWLPTVVEGIYKNQANIRAVLIDKQSNLAQYAEQFERAGIPVVLTGIEFMSLSCPAFAQSVVAESFYHRADPRLLDSIHGAAKRPLYGRYGWKRADSEADITVIVAASMALHGLRSEKVTSKIKKPKTGTVTIGGRTYTR